MTIETHVLYALRNATVNPWPFPHFFVGNVFPWDFYRGMIKSLAKKTDFSPSGHYGNRSFTDNNDFPGLEFMQGEKFLRHIMAIFGPDLAQWRWLGHPADLSSEVRLIRDGKGYKIGPHTDAPWKVVSLLFYIPPIQDQSDESHDYGFGYEEYGTSLYVPKDRRFRCRGGPHHKFEDFDRVHTAPYTPNSCLGFWKTDKSFHGVEPIGVEFHRDVLLYNIHEQQKSRIATP